VGQFALSLALVVSAVLLARTVSNLRHAPTGFATDEVALLAASPRAAQYVGPRNLAYVADALARLQREPGVVAVSYATVPPVNAGGSRATVHVPGYEPQPDEEMELNYNEISDDYFKALGIDVLDGQPLPPWRIGQAPIPMVVNTTMAQRYWPGARAVGQRLHLSDDTDGPLAEVVGVVADAKYRAMREAARPSYYVPLGIRASRDGTFHVRVHGAPSDALPGLRRALTEVDPAVPISDTRTLTSQLNTNITDDRMAMTIGVVLAIAALVLAGVGLFGAMSHMVGQRTREIGVRLALGATHAGIRRLVLGQAVLIATTGTLAGLALAGWATSFMASRLFGIGRFDPASFAGAALILAAVALLAAQAPARRASNVDPVNTLRQE
jgi:predicted permease